METFMELDEIITALTQANAAAKLIVTGIVYSPHMFEANEADNAFYLLETKYSNILDQLKELQSRERERATA